MLAILYHCAKIPIFSRKRKKSGDFRYTISGKEKCQAKNDILRIIKCAKFRKNWRNFELSQKWKKAFSFQPYSKVLPATWIVWICVQYEQMEGGTIEQTWEDKRYTLFKKIFHLWDPNIQLGGKWPSWDLRAQLKTLKTDSRGYFRFLYSTFLHSFTLSTRKSYFGIDIE
jgi:hypothetical protein